DTTLLINDTDGSTFSYADADKIVQMVARRLAAMGVSRGDHVVSCSSQHVEALLTCWAALMLGAVFVPLDHNLQKTTFGEIVGETAPKLVLCDFASWEKFADREELVIFDDDLPLTGNLVRFSEWLEQDSANEPAPYVQEPDDPAVILYTSGTSGRPKGVLLSHAALYCSGALMANTYSWNTDDILFSLGDYHTMSGLRNPCIASLFGGCSVVVASPASRCNALVVADCVTRHQATLLGSVPATIRQFNKFADRVGKQLLASLRQVICTGSVLTTEVAKEFETAYGLVVYNYYGLTETAGLCIGCTPDTQFDNPATVGKPLNCLVRIEDSAGKQLGSKQIGELLIYPANRMDGYYLNPELTNQVFENGWYRTGDFAMLEADGAVVLYGRSSDIVKNSSGDLINPQVVETIMEGLQEVAEAGVCGNVDASGEEYLTVFVVPSCAVDDEEQWLYALKAEAYKELGFLKMPYWLKRISALPVNSNGKLLRGQLKLLLSEEDV
ncbi:MAG: acyl--CoA ligase, partial [Planctomycetes bacterium]|nr:acyl--CoA ligase [Planctomycetota bacterium]